MGSAFAVTDGWEGFETKITCGFVLKPTTCGVAWLASDKSGY
jgi:hypothetical protein